MKEYLYFNGDLEVAKTAGLGENARRDEIIGGLRHITSVIDTKRLSASTGLAKGFYQTVEGNVKTDSQAISRCLYGALGKALDFLGVGNGLVLIVGLGNGSVTADALGKAVLQRLRTGEARDKFCLAKLEPSVSYHTNIESFDVIKGVVGQISPSVIIVVDSLATKNKSRLERCAQISTAGITAGAGVGNARRELSRTSLGVDVVSIGVPMVAQGSVFTGKTEDNEYIITTKEIGGAIELWAQCIANALGQL